MAEHAGYLVIDSAIVSQLADKCASAIAGHLKVTVKREKVTNYELPSVPTEIQQAFVKKPENMKHLTELRPSINSSYTTQSIEIGAFNPSPADNKPKSHADDSFVVVMIALTDLNPGNGMPRFLEGSHNKNKLLEAKQLKQGDVIAYRGSLTFWHSSGGGGLFEMLILV